jgi:SAM-dependent methyltransferase
MPVDVDYTVPNTPETQNHECAACGSARWRHWLNAPDRFHGRTESYALERCSSCGLVRLQHPPAPEEMDRHYGEDYDTTIAVADDAERWKDRRAVLLGHKSGGALLDLGCSTGGFLASLKGPDWRLFGIEMSDAVAAHAQRRSGATVFVGDVLDAPFSPNSFDAITAFHVMEHLYAPREVFAKIFEWLKPGGVFYMMVPNISSAGSKIFGSYWFALELPRHLHLFSPTPLRRLAARAGLREVSMTTHRELFIESSTRYVLDGTLTRLGFRMTPMAQRGRPGFTWRAVRKALRLTVGPAVSAAASLVGDGESIHAIFEKTEPAA